MSLMLRWWRLRNRVEEMKMRGRIGGAWCWDDGDCQIVLKKWRREDLMSLIMQCWDDGDRQIPLKRVRRQILQRVVTWFRQRYIMEIEWRFGRSYISLLLEGCVWFIVKHFSASFINNLRGIPVVCLLPTIVTDRFACTLLFCWRLFCEISLFARFTATRSWKQNTYLPWLGYNARNMDKSSLQLGGPETVPGET